MLGFDRACPTGLVRRLIPVVGIALGRLDALPLTRQGHLRTWESGRKDRGRSISVGQYVGVDRTSGFDAVGEEAESSGVVGDCDCGRRGGRDRDQGVAHALGASVVG